MSKVASPTYNTFGALLNTTEIIAQPKKTTKKQPTQQQQSGAKPKAEAKADGGILTPADKIRIRQEKLNAEKKLKDEELARQNKIEAAEKAEKEAAEKKRLQQQADEEREKDLLAQGFNKVDSHKKNKNQSELTRKEWEERKKSGEPIYESKKADRSPGDSPSPNLASRKNPKNFEIKEVVTQTRGSQPGREMDRHSQAEISRKPQTKRAGGGKFNVGNDVQQFEKEYKETGKVDPWNQTDDAPKEEKSGWGVESDASPTETESTPTTGRGDSSSTKNESTAVSSSSSSEPSPVLNKPKEFVPDPDDEGYGKMLLSDYEKEEAAKLEELQKIVGKVEPRKELEKKIDLSKCIQKDSGENKSLPSKGNKRQANTKQKSNPIDIYQLKAKEQTTPQEGPRFPKKHFNNPRPGRKVDYDSTVLFPNLGDAVNENYNKNRKDFQNQNKERSNRNGDNYDIPSGNNENQHQNDNVQQGGNPRGRQGQGQFSKNRGNEPGQARGQQHQGQQAPRNQGQRQNNQGRQDFQGHQGRSNRNQGDGNQGGQGQRTQGQGNYRQNRSQGQGNQGGQF